MLNAGEVTHLEKMANLLSKLNVGIYASVTRQVPNSSLVVTPGEWQFML